MLIAQIADLHVMASGERLFGRIDTNHALASAVAFLNQITPRPDLVLVVGDLVNDGTVDQYRTLRALLAPLTIPCRLLVGNHDDRANLRAVMTDHPYLAVGGDFIHYTIDDEGPVRVICLDTVIQGSPGGELCARRIGWLVRRLAEQPDRPTIVAMHHPPFVSGISHMDEMRCSGAGTAALGRVLGAFPCVRRILCGHLHRSVTVDWQGTVAMTCPSTAQQIGLELTAGARPGYTAEPPAVALHLWHPDHGLRSHLSFIGDYPVGRPEAG